MIVYAYPEHISRRPGIGNWKVVQGVRILLRELDAAFRVVEVPENRPAAVLDALGPEVTHLLVEYTFWPEVLEAARRRFPGLRIHVKTHNLEPLQHLHRCGFPRGGPLAAVRQVYGALRYTARDTRCRRVADTLLGISEWDDRHYWRHLPGRAAVRWLPYYCPWPELNAPQPEAASWQEREPTIVCMPGQRDAIGVSSILGCNRLAEGLANGTAGREWAVRLTPGIVAGGPDVPLSAHLRIEEQVDDPWALLCRVRALAVLTPLGFGIKTSIIDALAAGCQALVHPTLMRRLPEVVARHCIACDPQRTREWQTVAETLNRMPAANRVNDELRAEAKRVLTEVLQR